MPAIRLAVALALCVSLAESARALSIVPTFLGPGWDATRQGVVQHAIDDWESAIVDPHGFGIDFEFASLGSSGPLGQWSGSYTLSLGTDVYPWTPGVDHIVQLNSDAAGLWWDPTPSDAGADQPSATWDALSVTLHELGHALGFIDDFYVDDFANPGETDKWSQHVSGDPPIFDAGGLGVELEAVDELSHVADSGSTAGDLMVAALANGTRRGIGTTDLSMLELAYGVTVVPVPEPSTGALVLAGLALLSGRRAARERR